MRPFLTTFHVACKHCHHTNRPANNTMNSIRKVMRGEFTKCRKCGKAFTRIDMPIRPLVTKVATEFMSNGILMDDRVKLYEYEGNVPMAYGQ